MALFGLVLLHLTLVPADERIFIGSVDFIACNCPNVDVLLELTHLANGLRILVEEPIIVGWGPVESLLLIGVVSFASTKRIVHFLDFIVRAFTSLVLFLGSLPGCYSLRNVHYGLVLILVRTRSQWSFINT